MSLTTQFLTSVRIAIVTQDVNQLGSLLLVEPPIAPSYAAMGEELRNQFRGDSKVLEKLVSNTVPEEDDVPEGQGTGWPSFTAFMVDYLAYWREANFEDLIGTHGRLSALVVSCASALSHPTYGSVMLVVSIQLSQALAVLTRTLHTRPDLAAEIEERQKSGTDEEDKSVVEMTAEIITKIFTTCLNDRSSARFAAPKGKKKAVYKLANMVLKLLFMSKKTRPAQQLFTQLSTLSPPLKHYPAAERTTYLYYLGRFNLTNNHFLRASAALEEAYLQCPPDFISHRTQILTYLIPANLFLGRLPSHHLLSRPEAQQASQDCENPSLAQVFRPLAQSIMLGNFILFSHTLAQHENFLFRKNLLLALNARLRPLLWRSLARRIFVLTWQPNAGPGAMEKDGPRRAATLDLGRDLVAAAAWMQRILEGKEEWYPPSGSYAAGAGEVVLNGMGMGMEQGQQGMATLNSPVQPNIHPRDILHKPHSRSSGLNPVYLRAISNATSSSSFPPFPFSSSTNAPATPSPVGRQQQRTQPGKRDLKPLEGMLLSGPIPSLPREREHLILLIAGLVQMGWLRGYVALSQEKFAVSGVKQRGGDAVAAGWPRVWEVVGGDAGIEIDGAGETGGAEVRRKRLMIDVPGWIQHE